MNREQRKRRLQLKPHLDRLEMRRLMSHANAKALVAQALANQQAALETELAEHDLDAFAENLAHTRGWRRGWGSASWDSCCGATKS